MAIAGTEIEVLGPGISANSPEKGSYCQNMLWYDGVWQTRKGFGVIGEWDSTCSSLTKPGLILEPDKLDGYNTHVGSYLFKTDFGNTQIISIFKQIYYTTNGVNEAQTPTVSIFDYPTEHVFGWTASIYDVTDNQRWEEVIHSYTGEITSAGFQHIGVAQLMPVNRGYYESNRDVQTGNAVSSTSVKQISFAEVGDIVYFCIPNLGTYCYKPAAYIGNRSKAINLMPGDPDSKGYSESSTIIPFTLAPGVYSEQYSYLDVLPEITSITQIDNRLVYVTENALYFSDRLYHFSVIAGQRIVIPSENPITAAREINGNLLIFTKSETFLFQPATGFFIYKGVITKLSEGIGCLSSSSIDKFNNVLMWADSNGIYKNGGTLEIKTTSDNIQPFFKNYMSNPLSNYRIELGETNLDRPQPPVQYHLDPEFCTLTFCPSLKIVVFTVPGQRCSLVLSENNEWSLWSYDSVAFKAEAGGGLFRNEVGAHEFMDCQQILSDETDVYCIGLDNRAENKIKDDQASTLDRISWDMEPNINRNQEFRSYFISRYGRGGGCDRNIDNEDYRYGIGEWVFDGHSGLLPPPSPFNDQGINFDFIIGKPQKILPNFSWANGQTMGNRHGVLLPIQIRLPKTIFGTEAGGVSNRFAQCAPFGDFARTKWYDQCVGAMELYFQFDKDHWQPFLDPGTEKVKVLFKTPMENAQAGMGNVTNAYAMAKYREVQLYSAQTGALDATGNLIRIGWNANDAIAPVLSPTLGCNKFIIPAENALAIAGGAGGWESPLPVPADCITTIMWIPFIRVGDQDAVSGMGIESMHGHFFNNAFSIAPAAGSNYYRSWNYFWRFSSLAQSSSAHREDNVTQAVDWAYSSPPIGLDEGKQIKARGLFYQLLSHGTSDNTIENGWNAAAGSTSFRLLNTVVSSDNTQWQGQLVDQPNQNTGPSAIVESPPRTSTAGAVNSTGRSAIRTRVRDANGVMQYKVFGQPSNTWGHQGASSGTVLIDDPQFGEMAESTSTRGQWVNWMFFGYVLDKAETVVLRTAKAVLRLVGGRRRKGHSRIEP